MQDEAENGAGISAGLGGGIVKQQDFPLGGVTAKRNRDGQAPEYYVNVAPIKKYTDPLEWRGFTFVYRTHRDGYAEWGCVELCARVKRYSNGKVWIAYVCGESANGSTMSCALESAVNTLPKSIQMMQRVLEKVRG